MSRTLAICWNTSVVRFVLSELTKRGALRVLNAGEVPLLRQGSEAVEADNPNHDGDAAAGILQGGGHGDVSTVDLPSALTAAVQSIVQQRKASRARLVICLNRGLIDAAAFAVPPADNSELPTIVRNIAARHLSGISDDSVVDFVPESDAAGKVVRVTAMALPRPEQNLIERLARESGCASTRAIVITHPLRIFAPTVDVAGSSVSLVVSKGWQSGQLLLVRDGMPILSRSLRLPHEAKGDREAVHLASEVQKTLLAAEVDLAADIEIAHAVVIGAEIESAPLQTELSSQLGIEVRRVSATTVVDGDVGDAAVSAYAPLIAACAEDAKGTPPAVDFLNPRRPPKSASRLRQGLAAAAVALMLLGVGWYYVNSMFAEARAENARLRERSKELEELVGDTRSKRNLAKVLAAWEKSRMSWLDELRDLTIRTPSSPDLTIDQFSAAASGRDFVVSFRGTSKRPEVIRAMEEQLRDEYHAPKTPGIREVRNGRQSTWSFQTTMRVSTRPKGGYVSHLTETDARTASREPPRDATAAAAAAEERP
jgi:hypothetical protein